MPKRGPIPKPPDRRKERTALTVVEVAPLTNLLVPDPPSGLQAATKREWVAYWTSPLAGAVHPAQIPAVERLFTLKDEWRRYYAVNKKERLVAGSQGQPVVNPAAAQMRALENAILKLEQELGLTPFSAAKLGVAANNAKKTLAELNREAEVDAEVEDDDPRFA